MKKKESTSIILDEHIFFQRILVICVSPATSNPLSARDQFCGESFFRGLGGFICLCGSGSGMLWTSGMPQTGSRGPLC